MIEALVAWSVRQRMWVIAVWAALSLLAALGARHLKLDALPDVTSNQVQVLTRAPGLTPDEVELRVTRPIEVALGGMPGVEHHRSMSRYGLSAITVVFDDHVDPFRARQLVGERVAGAAGALPPGVYAPELGPMTGGLGEIFHFTVSSPGRTPAQLLELVSLRVVPILKQVPDVVEVNTWGGAQRTFEVRADPARMASRGVTLAELERAIGEGTGAVPGAALAAGNRQVLLRGAFRPTSHGEVGEALVRHDERGSVRVGDVATVVDGSLPRLGAATSDGRGELVYVMVQMLSGANAREVTAAVRGRMAEVRAVLPPDVQLSVVYDRSELVDATLRTVARSLAEGGFLVVLVLFLMLGSLRAGLLVALVIPGAMLVATAAMAALGISGNLMSLGAVDFGLLVDGAVVLVEHVFGHQGDARGSWVERVRSACVAVARPTFFGVTVILLVYLPILTLAGVDGKLFRPMALTVAIALVVALVFSLTFIPAAAASLLGAHHVPAHHPRLVRLLEHLHDASASWLAPRWPLAAVAVVAALVLGGTLAARAGSELAPQLDEGDLVVQTTRAPDVSLEHALDAASRLERSVGELPEVVRVVSRTGSPAVATDTMGIEQADVFVRLKPRDRWRPGLTRDGLLRQIEARIEQSAPGSEPSLTQPIQMRFNELLGGAPVDVVVSVFGPELEPLQRAVEQVLAAVGDEPGVQDARLLTPPSVPMLDVRPSPLRAAQAGLGVGETLAAVQALKLGLRAGVTYDGPMEVPIVLRLGAREPSAWDLGAASIPTPAAPVALRQVADIRERQAMTLVQHHNGERRAMVGFNVRGRDLASAVESAQRRVAARVALPEGCRLAWGGQYETFQHAQARLRIVVPLVLALIVLVLLINFRAAGPALLVLTHLPFACVGGMVALWLRDMPLSISAAVGFIALSGIAVMNGVVLLTDLRAREAAGASAAEAAAAAARARARPVAMTALVAALGFLPMALATGIGAEVQRPLATVVVGGLVTSTALTLLLLPALYPPLHALAALVRRRSP